MSRRGNCYDNAAMESWFSTFKFELGETFESIHRGKNLAFDYIEVFYNQRRRHSSIGYVAPAEVRAALPRLTTQQAGRNCITELNSHTMYNNTHGRDRSGHV